MRGKKTSGISVFCEQARRLRSSPNGKSRQEVQQEAGSPAQVRNQEKSWVPLLCRQEGKCRNGKDEQGRQEKEKKVNSYSLFFLFYYFNLTCRKYTISL